MKEEFESRKHMQSEPSDCTVIPNWNPRELKVAAITVGVIIAVVFFTIGAFVGHP